MKLMQSSLENEKESTVDLYGIVVEDLEVARKLIESILGVELNAHEGLYQGGDYYRKELDDGRLILQSNNDLLCQDDDPLEERWTEPEFSNYPILVYVEGHSDSDGIRSLLTMGNSQIRWLRREQG
jgi:hypothetical protein